MARPRKVSKKLIEDLKKKLAVKTDDSIYEKIRNLRKKIGTHHSIEVTACLFAAQNDLDPHRKKYNIDQETLNKANQISINQQPQIQSPTKPTRKATPKSPRSVNVGSKFSIKSSILPLARLNEAKMMADDIYPLLYVLENSLRELILRIMDDAYGKNKWWNASYVPDGIIKKVTYRISNEKNEPWHGKRGSGVHQIYYTDLLDLHKIIEFKPNWKKFKSIIANKRWLKTRLEEIRLTRNIIMHCNPLAPNDKKRLEVYFKDIIGVIEKNMSSIPNP